MLRMTKEIIIIMPFNIVSNMSAKNNLIRIFLNGIL